MFGDCWESESSVVDVTVTLILHAYMKHSNFILAPCTQIDVENENLSFHLDFIFSTKYLPLCNNLGMQFSIFLAKNYKISSLFDGEPEKYQGFLLQRQLYLISLGELSDPQKITVMMSLLTGRAIAWVSTVWEQGGEPTSKFDRFLAMFRQVFDHAPTPAEREIGDQLLVLKQGSRSMVDYALEFFCGFSADRFRLCGKCFGPQNSHSSSHPHSSFTYPNQTQHN